MKKVFVYRDQCSSDLDEKTIKKLLYVSRLFIDNKIITIHKSVKYVHQANVNSVHIRALSAHHQSEKLMRIYRHTRNVMQYAHASARV